MVQDFKVQLIAKKWFQVLHFSTDREIDPTDQKSQIWSSAEGYFSPITTKTFRVSLKLLQIYKENPNYILKTFRRLVYYSLWDLRGSVPSSYTRFYWRLNYNQGLVELVAESRSSRRSDLKLLSGVSKTQARVCLCCCKSKKRRSPWIRNLHVVVLISYYWR